MGTDVVDQFAGPGGWDVACSWLGLNVLGIEKDAAACATRRAAGHLTFETDIRKVGPIRAHGLISSPVCTSYSAAGKGEGRKNLTKVLRAAYALVQGEPWDHLVDELDADDPTTALVLEPLHWAMEMHKAGTPYRWIALEQVPPVLPIWEYYAEVLRWMGYSVATGVLHSEQYGVPQTRRRAVLVASLDHDAVLPTPTHSKYHVRNKTKLDEGVKPWVSMAEALGWGTPGRPSPTITSGGTGTGGAEPFGNGARQALSKARDEGEWILRSNYGTSGNSANRGERALDEPAPTVTSKVDRNKWQMLAAGKTSPQTSGARARDLEEPSATLTSKGTAVWVGPGGLDPRTPATTVADSRLSARSHHFHGEQGKGTVLSDEVREAHENGAYAEDAEPSVKGSMRVTVEEAAILQSFPKNWEPGVVFRNGNQAHSAKRHLDQPAPTIHFSERANKVEWMPEDEAGDPAASGVRVTVDEASALQSFPKSWLTTGTRPGATRRQVSEPAPTLAFGNDAASTVFHGDGVDLSEMPAAKIDGRATRIETEEASALSSFLPGYPWQGKKTKQFEQVGNVVPPRLALAILGTLIGVDWEAIAEEQYGY